MTDLVTELSRPRGSYGVDGDYRLIPPAVVAGGYAVIGLAGVALSAFWLGAGSLVSGTVAGLLTLVWILTGLSFLRFTLRGKFEAWARILAGLGLRGDEHVLDIGCGRGAVLLAAARLVPEGRAVGVDIWRADQTGNSVEATLRNAEIEGVAGRVELRTEDMTRLGISDASFDLIVSSLAIHNLPDGAARRAAVDEAVRVLRPGGRIAIVDIGFTRGYAKRLRHHGLTGVRRTGLGPRGWWAPFVTNHLVTGTKPEA